MNDIALDPETYPILKDLVFEGSSLKDLRAMPSDVRKEMGYALDQIQRGFTPASVSRLTVPGKGVSGVHEIRIDEDGSTYRSAYVAKHDEALYVLHVFQKKSTRGIATPKPDLDLIRDRFRALTRRRSDLGFT